MIRKLEQKDKGDWAKLYNSYADFYKVPMNTRILETLWGWIFDEPLPWEKREKEEKEWILYFLKELMKKVKLVKSLPLLGLQTKLNLEKKVH